MKNQSEEKSEPRRIFSMHTKNAVTWGGKFGGQTSFGGEKTPKVQMYDVGNGVLLKSGTEEAFVPMENVLILLYA